VSIERAAALLRAGKLVAFPTETVYGLGANALDEAAVRRIYEVKGRPATSPLIVHVDSVEMARGLAARWPEVADKLAARYWPGPLTLVVPKRPIVPDVVTAGLPTVGLRMPAHPLALELIRSAGLPLAGPSANRFTELSPTTAEHVRRSLGDSVDCILDGGPTTVGIESTVLSLAGPRPVLLRPGVIPPDEIATVAGDLDTQQAAEGAHPSPGMHLRHYQPRTPLVLGDPPGRGSGTCLRRGIEMPMDPLAYAAALYDTLHRLDEEGWDWIAIEPPPDTPEWAGVLDRLRRASR
jgi:L-threonylcarbamoyladenylate synthase